MGNKRTKFRVVMWNGGEWQPLGTFFSYDIALNLFTRMRYKGIENGHLNIIQID